jgi:competence protein ComGC
MAAKGSRGSIILEILITLMVLLLLAVIFLPDKIWKEEAQTSKICRDNMNALYEAQRFYYQKNANYNESLPDLLTFVQKDSGINRRQSLVSLTNSFTKVLNNILTVPSIQNISKMSQASFEITGDLVGNERYFRKYENLAITSEEIIREMMNLDSSALFPNFSRSKLFVDSLHALKESVTDFPLQIAVLRAINSADSLSLYYSKLEKESFTQFWRVEYAKISKLINDIRATDIVKVSSVSDRLGKFIDQINTNLQLLNTSIASKDVQSLEVEKQNLKELHQKFLSPEFFIITKSKSLTALSETDSIIINLSQNNFVCPDNKKPYILDTVKARITIECPNLLDDIQKEFQTCVKPIMDLPLYEGIREIDATLENTKTVLDKNREELKRYTDILLKIKELQAEFGDLKSVFFYKYAQDVNEFTQLVQSEKKLSVLRPAIENILNPIDTLAARMEKGDITDLEKKLNYYNEKLQEIDETVAMTKLPANVRNRLQSNVEPFQPVFKILEDMKAAFNPTHVTNLRKAENSLEKALLKAMEGRKQSVYVIFSREHVNHGNISAGEKSWEE